MILGQEKPPVEELAHFGVLGMKWGVHARREAHAKELAAAKERVNSPGYFNGKPFSSPFGNAKTTGQIKKEVRKAKSDAEEWARAKMYYGEGAGNRRKRIMAIIDSRSAGNPEYHKEFQKHLDAQDMGKHADKARTERRLTDAKNKTAKTARGVSHMIRGNMRYASALAAGLFVVGAAAHQAGMTDVIVKAGKTAYHSIRGTKMPTATIDLRPRARNIGGTKISPESMSRARNLLRSYGITDEAPY